MRGLSVLVVDDLAGARRYMQQVLIALGVGKVTVTPDGESAIAALREEPPDLLLCDYVMKPMSGLDLVREVRHGAASPNRYLPILMVSAFASEERVASARDGGVTEFLAKPLTVRRLVNRILEVAERPRPFVQVGGFFGPSRRRRPNASWPGPYRRRDDRKLEADVVEF
jgi:CheY-like chemotaxis protein